jgi:hypothetical protein
MTAIVKLFTMFVAGLYLKELENPTQNQECKSGMSFELIADGKQYCPITQLDNLV